MFLAPFEAPMLKIERAKRHLQELETTITEYQRRARPTFVKTDREINPWEVRIAEQVPKGIPLIVGDIAHSLRSALDVMLCDIAALRDVGLQDMAFPFADSAEKFKDKLAAPNKTSAFKKLGGDVIRLIEESQPFNGGNKLLRGLHDINNQDKHRMALPMFAFLSCSWDRASMFRKANAGLTIITLEGSLLGLEVGKPIEEFLYVKFPFDCIAFNENPVILMFPDGYFFQREQYLPKMNSLIDHVAEKVEIFKSTVV
jgi:hypothetical protein